MGKVKFQDAILQRDWFVKLQSITHLNVNELARICSVSPRTFRDWRRAKFNIPHNTLLTICTRFKLPFPTNVTIVSDYWYVEKGAKKGALRRMELYGPPGTLEGREKGGKVSQKRRRDNPEKYRLLNCNIRKNFKTLKESTNFAEVVGILLGDGCITNSQIDVTLDRKVDREYALVVQALMKDVFGELPSLHEYEDDNTIKLRLSGIDLVEQLSTRGLVKGDKIRRQVDLPKWVKRKLEYQIACVRGLVDTDGGLYFHNHFVQGYKCKNLGFCYVSYSDPMLFSVSDILNRYKIKHSLEKHKICIYNLKGILRYFRIFGTSNTKHLSKLNNYLLSCIK